MRKRIDPSISKAASLGEGNWIDLEASAAVEVTSEDPARPIEAALVPGKGLGWWAAEPGPQTIRIRFDHPRDLRLIHLVFTEEYVSRTQEFVLRWSAAAAWSAADAQPWREIVRQQYYFNPPSSEVEDYAVALTAVTTIELEIHPSIQGHPVHAQLTELRLR